MMSFSPLCNWKASMILETHNTSICMDNRKVTDLQGTTNHRVQGTKNHALPAFGKKIKQEGGFHGCNVPVYFQLFLFSMCFLCFLCFFCGCSCGVLLVKLINLLVSRCCSSIAAATPELNTPQSSNYTTAPFFQSTRKEF